MSEYRIVEEKGRGGEGVVYLARNDLGVKVALKKVLDDDRAMKEARKLAQIGKHDNVVEVQRITRDVEGHVGQPYIVMDYVEGEALTLYLERFGRLTPSAWWRLLVPILNGVRHIHTSGHVHRDLKPDNIVIEDKSGHPNPVIVDFGLATQHGQFPTLVGGTPQYCPPEFEDPEDIGSWSDIFSLAVMSYEALYGQLDWPIDLKKMQEILRKDQDPFKSAIAEGLERNTYDRPQSVWNWIVAMASPAGEDPRSLPNDGCSREESGRTDTKPAATSGTVRLLRRKIEDDYGLPEDCVVLRRRDGRAAGGNLSIEKLQDDHTRNSYNESETLMSLSKAIGERYGLGQDCVRFRDPNKKGGPVQNRLYQGNTKVRTMLESYPT